MEKILELLEDHIGTIVLIFSIVIIVISLLIILKYGSIPVADLPTWVWWLLK